MRVSQSHDTGLLLSLLVLPLQEFSAKLISPSRQMGNVDVSRGYGIWTHNASLSEDFGN